MRIVPLIFCLWTGAASAGIDPKTTPLAILGGRTCREFVLAVNNMRTLEEQREEFPYRKIYVQLDRDIPIVELPRVTHPKFAELPWMTRTFYLGLVAVESPALLIPSEEVKVGKNRPPYRKGRLDESARQLSPRERRTAQLLLDEGWDLVATVEGQVQRQRCPEGEASHRIHSHLLYENDDGPSRVVAFDTRVEFKNLESTASKAVVDRVLDSLRSGGQAPFILLDTREFGMPADEAYRGIRRLTGALKSRDLRMRGYPQRIRRLRITGRDYEFDVTYTTVESMREIMTTYFFPDALPGREATP